MAWTDIIAPVVGDATKKVSFADAVIGNLVYLKANMGGSGSGGGSLITNGNFELDGDSDGIPDGWDLTEYTAGAFALDESTPGEGARGIKFTSPGATGGGDLQSTDFFPVGPGKSLCVDFVHYASVAGIHDLVEIRWYSTALEADYISTSTIYDSISNPTSKTRTIGYSTPPSTARFAKLKLVGAKNDNATAGIAYFDDVSIYTGPPVSTVVGFTTAAGAAGNITIGGTLSGYVTISETATGGGFGARSGVAGGTTVSVVAGAATVDLVLPVGLWTIIAGAIQSYVGEGSVTTTVLAAMAIREM